jgi:hypothetical protein
MTNISKVSESNLQIQCVKWFDLQYPNWSQFLFHIRNGGSMKSAREGRKFKLMGVRKGVPDLFLSIPNDEFHGFYIELKKPGGKPSTEQVTSGLMLENLGYKFMIIDDIEVFMTEIKRYFISI